MKHPARIDQGKIQLGILKLYIRAGFPGKRKGTVSRLVKSHKRQSRKNTVVKDDALCFDTGFRKRPYQQLSESIVSDFSQ